MVKLAVLNGAIDLELVNRAVLNAVKQAIQQANSSSTPYKRSPRRLLPVTVPVLVLSWKHS